jgi:phosphoglycolate phosphatase
LQHTARFAIVIYMKKLHNIKAVGFDLDDTLVATEEFGFNLENEALAMIGRQTMDRKIHQETWGQHLYEAILERSPGVDVEKFREAFNASFKKHLKVREIDVLAEKTRKALIELGKRAYYLFILTGRDGTETTHLTEGNHPILVHFRAEDIFHRDNLDYHKPDPRVFDWLMQKGFRPEECAYVGDSIYDGQAANGAGLHFVASLESGLKTKDDFSEVEVSAFVNDLSELPDILP